jgi:hypothetical protein
VTYIGNIGARKDFVIKQGSDFGPFAVTVYEPANPPAPRVPMNLSTKLFRGQVRRPGVGGALAADLVIVLQPAPGGPFVFSLPSSVTAVMQCGDRVQDSVSQYVYDIEMVDTATGRVDPVMYGDIPVAIERTKS